MWVILSAALALFASPALADRCRDDYARLPSVTAESDALASLKLAIGSWQNAVRPSEVLRKIIRIARDPATAADSLDYLRKISAQNAQLIAKYSALSRDGKAPVALRRFQFVVDRLISLISRRAAYEETQRAAKKMKVALSNVSNLLDENTFAPIKHDDVNRRIQRHLLLLHRTLDPNELPTPQRLAEVVEEVDQLVALSQVQQALRPTPAGETMLRNLTKLREDVGVVHEQLVTQATGDGNHFRQRSSPAPALRTKLEDLRQVLRRTLRLNSAAALPK